MMSKLIVETTGPFQLVDYNTRTKIPHRRPAVTRGSEFISARALAGQVRVLAEVGDAATDDELKAYLKDSEDKRLAVEAFVAAFPVTADVPAPVETPVEVKAPAPIAPLKRRAPTKKKAAE